MHIPTHILSGWVVGNAIPVGPRERLACMISAAVPDVDGLGIIFGEAPYQRFHHVVGHNVFFGLLVCAGLTFVSPRRRWLTFVACLVCFHLHLLMDFYGSGVGWRIYYWWPADSHGFKTNDAWPLTSWQNYLAFALLAAGTLLIARAKRRTPLELLLPRFEAAFRERLGRPALSRGDKSGK